MELESWQVAWLCDTEMQMRLSGCAVSYFAMLEKITDVSGVEWYDKKLSRLENKMRMKEVGVATSQLDEFLHENSILSLAKAIEDTSVHLKRSANFKFHSVKNHHNVCYLKELQMIRALANVIKHNVSKIERNSSESAKFLVDNCDMKDGVELRKLISSQHYGFNITEYIPKVYIAFTHLIEKAFGIRYPILDMSYEDAFDAIYLSLLPDALSFSRPTKSHHGDPLHSAVLV